MQTSLDSAPPPQDLPAHGLMASGTTRSPVRPVLLPLDQPAVRISHGPDMAEAASGVLRPPAS